MFEISVFIFGDMYFVKLNISFDNISPSIAPNASFDIQE